MDMKDEGICRFCLKTFAGRSIGRHLTACKAKKEQDEATLKGKKKTQLIYHLKITSYKPFWLYIEMPAGAKLQTLDRFLRDIWLECCGHLSEFTINGVGYSSDSGGGDSWGMESESMNVALKKVLGLKDTFRYEYDFGSTTEVSGQVYGQREGVLKEKIRILARNEMPEVHCTNCSKTATDFCTECDDFYCAECLEKHDCGDDMALPVVNSPRMGVCGYYGDEGFDTFSAEQAAS